MDKISIQEISTVLMEKNGLKRKEADLFVQTMFDIIKESLATDRVVKVKGLGTFKIVDIEPRESVNVNTGERVLIEGHDKITFTPDNTMKELVNKPFSQFETVVLNEGVAFDDMPDNLEAEPEPEAKPEPKAELELETQQPEPEPKPEPEPEEQPEPEPEAKPEIKPELEPEPKQEPQQPEPEPEPEKLLEIAREQLIIENEEIEEEYMSKRMTYIAFAIAIVACILSFVAGYYYRDKEADSPSDEKEILAPVTIAATDSTAVDSVKSDTIDLTAPTAEKETVANAEPKPESDNAASKPEVKDAAVTESKADVDSEKYEKMDARVRTGAYRIIGTDYQMKVRAGDTFAKIARRTLGPDMECYIQVFNDLKTNDELKEGQTIQIPKLELKKKKKVNN